MNTWDAIRAGGLLLLGALAAGCEPEVGSARWCDQLGAKPKTDWSLSEAADYARHCLVEATEVGSERWCRKLADKPKAQWSADEAASYAKHCLIGGSRDGD